MHLAFVNTNGQLHTFSSGKNSFSKFLKRFLQYIFLGLNEKEGSLC